ncbi:putative Sulfate anion transporter 1 [Hypsibius exemplaris]|uniref:Sulfate anion transporter 1 n=1 Tax=Hypsibius exemplaris TaxID=2072580 RepID=A0A1W0X6L8_HYPEX|nr:putative Sulfate anion transporter 1 [Hypsibius exemplaris]
MKSHSEGRAMETADFGKGGLLLDLSARITSAFGGKNSKEAAQSVIVGGRFRRMYAKNFRTNVLAFLPIIRSLRASTWRSLSKDFCAGIIVGCIHIPQSMGTGMVANLGPLYGIYLTFFPGLLYAVFGSSFHNSVGAFAPSAGLVGVAVARIRLIFSEHYLPNQTIEIVPESALPELARQHVEIAVTITLMAGIIQLAIAFFRLEFLSRIFSHNVLDPLNCACALQIMLVQIPNMLGVNLDMHYGLNKHIGMVILLLTHITERIQWLDTLLSVITASIIIGFRDFVQPCLFKKLKVICMAGTMFGLLDTSLWGRLPKPFIPDLARYMPFALFDGLLGALVSIAYCMQATKPAARKHGYRVNTKQELLALGASNVFISFFSCCVTSSNIGRIVILDSMGASSQIATLFACILTRLMLAFASGALYYLPFGVIATIITLTLSMTLKLFNDLPEIWRLCRTDAVQWMLTFVSCVLLDLQWGLLVGLTFSWIRMQYQLDEPHLSAVMKPPFSTLQNTGKLFQAARKSEILLFRAGPSLNYANTDKFTRRVLLSLDYYNSIGGGHVFPESSGVNVIKHVIIDCFALIVMDSSGYRGIIYLLAQLTKHNVKLWLPSCSETIRRVLQRQTPLFPAEQFTDTVEEADQLIKQQSQEPEKSSLIVRAAISQLKTSENDESTTAFWQVAGMTETDRRQLEQELPKDPAHHADLPPQDEWSNEVEEDVLAVLGELETKGPGNADARFKPDLQYNRQEEEKFRQSENTIWTVEAESRLDREASQTQGRNSRVALDGVKRNDIEMISF